MVKNRMFLSLPFTILKMFSSINRKLCYAKTRTLVLFPPRNRLIDTVLSTCTVMLKGPSANSNNKTPNLSVLGDQIHIKAHHLT